MSTHATSLPLAPAAGLTRARLPRWCLAADWPAPAGRLALADLTWSNGRVTSVRPSGDGPLAGHADLAGAPLLPALVDAHTHLDKTFTLPRIGAVEPGLLAAIAAIGEDRSRWTAADVRARAARALAWAHDAGVSRLRTHVDWWEVETPLAWHVLRELAEEWTGRVAVERVSLNPLPLFEDREVAQALARDVARSGPGALLGGFVHSTNWSATALRHLLEAARAFDLDVDLHVDEELNPAARGLAEIARLLGELRFEGRVVCGHTCTLSAQDESQALATLDAVARQPITLVSLPITNLLLQDARTGRTPRQRGITLVKEAQARGIPLLIASDNVEDPFCAVGSYDPVEALGVGVLAAQMPAAFDSASEAVCRGDWLTRSPRTAFGLVDEPADFIAFTRADVSGWPSRAQARVVWRGGEVVAGEPPARPAP